MKLDSKKLLRLITEDIADLKRGYSVENSVCIGEIDGMKIVLLVTKEDGSYSAPTEENNCLS